jgi:hypothetical protein
MIVDPTKEYTLTELRSWFSKAINNKEELTIDPCNPQDAPVLQTKAIIRTMDDLAILTQWLGGIAP